MLDVIEQNPLPDWLASETTDRPVLWKELLNGSLYYPACGTDGHPVQYFGGHCHSFVYADYGYSFKNISDVMKQPGSFKGYRLLSARLLDQGEINLADDWATIHIDPQKDGDPNRYRARHVRPYAYWCIFERLPSHGVNHGPIRFSLLYLGMDGVAFHALFVKNEVAPSVVAIIQPGEGFGWNWTYFFDFKQVFCRTVLENPAGRPRYLLLGGYQVKQDFQRDVVWPGYEKLQKFWKTSNGYLGLWESVDSDLTCE